MTKLKSKKASKSTLALIVMTIVVVALLAFGGTYAFFTATAKSKSGTVTVGKIDLSLGNVEIVTNTALVYGDTIINDDVVYTAHPTANEIVVVKYAAGTVGSLFAITTGSDFTLIGSVEDEVNHVVYSYYYAKADALVSPATERSLTFIDGPVTVTGSETYLQTSADALAAVKTVLKAQLLESADYTTATTAAGANYTSLPDYIKTALSTAYADETDAAAAIDAVVYNGEHNYAGQSVTIEIEAMGVQFRGLSNGSAVTVETEATEWAKTGDNFLPYAKDAANKTFGVTIA